MLFPLGCHLLGIWDFFSFWQIPQIQVSACPCCRIIRWQIRSPPAIFSPRRRRHASTLSSFTQS